MAKGASCSCVALLLRRCHLRVEARRCTMVACATAIDSAPRRRSSGAPAGAAGTGEGAIVNQRGRRCRWSATTCVHSRPDQASGAVLVISSAA